MGYCYGKRIAAEPTGVVLELREVCGIVLPEERAFVYILQVGA